MWRRITGQQPELRIIILLLIVLIGLVYLNWRQAQSIYYSMPDSPVTPDTCGTNDNPCIVKVLPW